MISKNTGLKKMKTLLIAAILHLALASPARQNDDFDLPVQMPSIPGVSGVGEIYLCTTVPIPDESESYHVVGFEPKAHMTNVHHMLLFACETPGLASTEGQQAVWACGHDPMHGKLYPERGVCGAGVNKLIYAWARNAKKIDLPKGVGFEVGSGAETRHMIVQVHFSQLNHDNDTSGIQVRMTKEDQPLKAGVLILGSIVPIPPMSTMYLETSCQLPKDNMKIHPIGFRTHTHNLGTVVSGYKVDEAKKQWALIGKMDPRRPQAFYPVENPDLVVKGGEYLAARCTMVSDRNTTTAMGGTNMDEMCNYYVMYYINPLESGMLNGINCWSTVANQWQMFDNIPADASEFEGHTYLATP